VAIVGGSWTYSGNPAASDKDAARFLIGDTDGADQLLSDEEIEWLLGESTSVYGAAAKALETIVAQGRFVDKSVGDLSLSASQRAEQAMALVKTYRAKAAKAAAVPYIGGVSVAEKQAQERNPDVPSPAFRRGQFDHPGTSQDGDGGHGLVGESTRFRG